MITLRQVTDIETLMRWREEVIENVFGTQPDRTLLNANLRYYQRHIEDGSHQAYVANMDGEDAGCGAVCITEELPSPDNPSGRCAYLMNIYVREPYRKHGLGHKIVKELILNARNAGCDKIYLETTDEGRNVYASLGFNDMPDMMKLKTQT